MMPRLIGPRERFDAPCTVEVSHRHESLHAHVEFDDDIRIWPGDEVKVNGPQILAPFGAVITERRVATVTRAGWLERTWTRLTGDLNPLDLVEYNFSEERRP